MANTSGRIDASLKETEVIELFNNNDFFYALWRLLQKNSISFRHSIRFHIQPELSFFGRDATKIKYVDGIYHIYINFTGLLGTQGTLPLYLREKLLKSSSEKRSSYLVLYDLLQQRTLQFFYHAWFLRRLPLQSIEKNSPIKKLLKSLTGVSATLPLQYEENDDFRYYFSAHFANPHRPQSALQQILSVAVDVPVNILSMQGIWVSIPENQRTYLKKGASAELGHNAICGTKYWSFQDKFRIIVGPVNAGIFQDFLPKKRLFILIQNLLTRYINQYFLCELQILIDNVLVQPCLLNAKSWNYLGQCCFLGKPNKKEINSSIIFKINYYK